VGTARSRPAGKLTLRVGRRFRQPFYQGRRFAREAIPLNAPLRSYIEGRTLGERAANFLSAFREVWPLALIVTIMNVGGVAYGIYYYWDQLRSTAWYLLPFVPDSPAGPFVMILVYGLFWLRGRVRSPTLDLLAFVWLIKYGLWTMLAFYIYRDYFFTPDSAQFSWILFWFHFGEAMEAGILLKGMRFPRLRWAAFVAFWVGLGDFSDYVLDTHPRLPSGLAYFAWVPVITVSLSFICYLAALLWCRRVTRGSRKGESGPAGEGGTPQDHDSTRDSHSADP